MKLQAMALRILSIAAATGRIAYVYLIGDRLMDWRISDKASTSTEEARAASARWIETLQPDVVVTEIAVSKTRKGDNTRQLIEAMAIVAEESNALDVKVTREQSFANKYEEAAVLADRYPELSPWVPRKRRFFDNEHRNTVLFEALALAQSVLRNPSATLGAAMG
jgi:hypothetical protein